MAELLRIEPALFNKNEGWFIFSDGRKYLRKLERPSVEARSDFPCPAIHRDSIDPIRGADLKMHESLSSYRRSLRADGNPFGESYIEIGNESPKFEAPQYDRKQRRDDIRAAIEDVRNDRVPPLTILED